MAVKKVGTGEIPREVLGDLEVLLAANAKEYVAIGSNFYEIRPTPAIRLMDVLSRFLKMIDNMREQKAEILNKTNDDKKLNQYEIFVGYQDIISNPEAIGKIKDILIEILDGVDPEDIEKISIGQVMDTVKKLISINIDTLPQSFKDQFLVMAPKKEAEPDPLDQSTSETSQS